jgi:hypothetical protein
MSELQAILARRRAKNGEGDDAAHSNKRMSTEGSKMRKEFAGYRPSQISVKGKMDQHADKITSATLAKYTDRINAIFVKMDVNKDGSLCVKELTALVGDKAAAVMGELDSQNHDGSVQRDEWTDYFKNILENTSESTLRQTVQELEELLHAQLLTKQASGQFFKGWMKKTNANGVAYYFNDVTNETSWETPPEVIAASWVEHWDEASEAPYFHNLVTEETMWDKPQAMTDSEDYMKEQMAGGHKASWRGHKASQSSLRTVGEEEEKEEEGEKKEKEETKPKVVDRIALEDAERTRKQELAAALDLGHRGTRGLSAAYDPMRSSSKSNAAPSRFKKQRSSMIQVEGSSKLTETELQTAREYANKFRDIIHQV